MSNKKSTILRILDVGCGEPGSNEGLFKQLAGGLPYHIYRCDIDKKENIDFIWDVSQPPPAKEIGKYDIVTAIHVLEHVSFHKTITTIKNILSTLKRGGILYIAVPSLEWAMEEVLNGRADYRVQLVLYGMQTDEHQYHKAGFSIATLRQLINSTGLAIVKDAFRTNFFIRYQSLEFECLQNCFLCLKL